MKKQILILVLCLMLLLCACKNNVPAGTTTPTTAETPTTTTPVTTAHVHSYTQTVISPSCTEDGYTENTCACGDSYRSDEVGALGHTWTDATCTDPKTCSVCSVTDGEAKGHSWTDATCTDPKICSVCNTTDGEAKGHSWTDATCTDPKTCSVCNTTDGEALGHDYKDGACTRCEEADPSYPALADGVWWFYRLSEEGSLRFCTLRFTENIVSYAAEYAFDITELTEELQNKVRENEPARLIEYGGKTYVMPRASFGAEANFTINGTILEASTEDFDGGTLTLERVSWDRLIVKKSTGFYSLKEGDELVYAENVHKHMFLPNGCEDPMRCVSCGETKAAPGHKYENGICTACGAEEKN